METEMIEEKNKKEREMEKDKSGKIRMKET